MPVIQDKEFGNITIRRSSAATQVRVRVAPNGSLRASLPRHAPIFLVKHLVKSSRNELRAILAKSKSEYKFEDGIQIGKSHTLSIVSSPDNDFYVKRHGQTITVKLPNNKQINDIDVSRKVRDTVITALRVEARSYLPKRLLFLANKFGYEYEKVRFSHASGRWGSYSSNGTVSLNIALMKLPFDLIDYIIIHELAHSKQMNHGKNFWALVESADPNYKIHRRVLKSQNPTL